MKTYWTRSIIATAIAGVCIAAARPAGAQETPLHNVISANPFGLLLEWFNAEYERVVSESSTVGFGGSFIESDGEQYRNADAFFRFYPSGVPLDGWAFGIKAGATRISGHDTYFGYGFDANRSWLLGRNQNFYVGIGFGLKRLVNAPDDAELKVIPTFRIVNVGFAF